MEFDISKELNDEQISMQNQFINQYQYFTDPISQLVQYFLFQTDSSRMIVDGLNIYSLKHQNLSDEVFKDNNPTVHTGITQTMNIVFPFFQGLHKLDKKNNLQEIKMSYIEDDDIKFPVQYDINSKKFSAKLYLKSYKIKD